LSVTIYVYVDKYTLENTEGAIQNGQSRETGNVGYTIRSKTQHNMCWTSLYTQTNTNNVNKVRLPMFQRN